jgi:4-amino-4-deoxy-L-arabinose transferase-like glycosyltransferase
MVAREVDARTVTAGTGTGCGDRFAWLVACGAACLALAGKIFVVLSFPVLRAPFTYEYEGIADNILSGRGFLFPHLGLEYLSMRPLFVYVCVAVYWLTAHSHLAMLVVQAAISGLAVLVTFLIARRLAGATVAWVAALLIAIEPALVYYDVTRIHPLGLQTLLLSLVVLAFLRLLSAPSGSTTFLAGLATGMAIYERGTPIVFAPVGLIFAMASHRTRHLPWLRMVMIFVIGAAVVLSPWIVRNYRVYGRFVLVMTADPELLWIGNNPNATGLLVTGSGKPMFDAAPEAFRAQILAGDERSQQQLFWNEFVRFVTSEPGRTLDLFVKKLYYFWWFSPQSGREHPQLLFLLYMPVYAVILFAALWGFGLGLCYKPREFSLLFLFLLAISAGQSLFFVEGRHRLAVMPVLLVPGAVGLGDLASRVQRLMAVRRTSGDYGTKR